MSDKTKKLLKFILTIGIVVSAVTAVFAVITKMQKKLNAVSDDECEGDVCGGSCAECGICSSDEDSSDEADDEESDEQTEENN